MKIDFEAYEGYEEDGRRVHKDVGGGALEQEAKQEETMMQKGYRATRGKHDKGSFEGETTETIVTPENSLKAFLGKTERNLPVYVNWVANSMRSYPEIDPYVFGMNGDGKYSAKHEISKITFPVDKSIEDKSAREADALANLGVALDTHIRIWKEFLKEKDIKPNKLSEEELNNLIASSIEEMVGVE